MTPRRRKLWLLLAFALLILAGVLTSQGCAVFPPDLKWKRVHAPSADHKWIELDRDEMDFICKGAPMRDPNRGGCAFPAPRGMCVVYSFYSEDEAKRALSVDGLDLFTHEVWNADKSIGHCAGFVHERGM